MSKILVYGDSNTWGDNPSGRRYPEEQQWVNILKSLSPGLVVDQHGVCARIAGDYEKGENEYRNGKSYFHNSIRASGPFDILIVALGTNDLKTYYGQSTQEILKDLLWYADAVEEFVGTKYSLSKRAKPVVYFLSIPNFINSDYFEGNESVRREVNDLLRLNVENFIDIGEVRLSSDGVHFTPEGHMAVAGEIYKALKESL